MMMELFVQYKSFIPFDLYTYSLQQLETTLTYI
jgi:hypothetical protein